MTTECLGLKEISKSPHNSHHLHRRGDRQKERKEDGEEGYEICGYMMHEITDTMVHGQDLHNTESINIPAWKAAPPLAKKLFAIGSCWEREKWFSLRLWLWVGLPTPVDGPTPYENL